LASASSLLKARWVALSAALAVFALFLFAPAVLNDGDTYLHIAAGRWMIENWAVLRIDFFSYTFAGHPWITHEWLSEVLMALAYVTAGWSSTVLLFAIAGGLMAWLLGYYLGKHLSGLPLLATLVLALSSMAGSFLARPHILALPLMVVWTAELIRAADEGRQPPYWLLCIMVLWANMHASFAFGLAFILPMALEDALKRGLRVAAQDWALFAVLAVLAALATPHGIYGLLFPLDLLSKSQLYAVGEWSPLDLHRFQPAILMMGLALFVFLSRGMRIAPLRLILLLFVSYLALVQVRHVMLLAIMGSLLLARPLADLLTNQPDLPTRGGRKMMLGFGLVFVLLAGVRLLIPLQRGDGITTPATALAHVPAKLLTAPVLNDYQFGGYLIYRDLRPFIDGRVELYSGRFLNRYLDIVSGNPRVLADTLTRYHVRWTILAPANPASAVMDTMPGWKRLYSDPYAVVHVKTETL